MDRRIPMIHILRNAIQTPDGSILNSTHRWDYQEHTDTVDGQVYVVDGGLDYFRGSLNGWTRQNSHPNFKDLRVTTDSPHELIREVFEWTSVLDKNGMARDEPVKIPLKDLDDGHIKALVKWTADGYPEYVHKIMLDELDWRDL
jgi:hypothetical protein